MEELLPVLVAIGSGSPLVITLIVKSVRWARRRGRARSTRMREVCGWVSGLQPAWPGSELHPLGEGCLLLLDGGAVRLEVETPERICCRGRFPLPAGPIFTIRPETLADSIAKERGVVDLELGEPELDRGFMVRSSTPELTRRVIARSTQRLILERYADLRLRSDGEEVVLEYHPSEGTSPDQLAATLSIVHAIVSVDLFGLAALRSLPDAVEIVRGGPVLRIPLAGGVLLGPAVRDRVARTRVWIEHRAPVPALRIEAGAGAVPGQRPEVLGRLARLGEGTLEREGRTTAFWFPAVETDPHRLLAAAELVTCFAEAAVVGPYR